MIETPLELVYLISPLPFGLKSLISPSYEDPLGKFIFPKFMSPTMKFPINLLPNLSVRIP